MPCQVYYWRRGPVCCEVVQDGEPGLQVAYQQRAVLISKICWSVRFICVDKSRPLSNVFELTHPIANVRQSADGASAVTAI